MNRTAEELAALKRKREEKDAKALAAERARQRGRARRMKMTDGDLLKALDLSDAELDGLMDKDTRRRFQLLLVDSSRKPRVVSAEEPPPDVAAD